MKISIAIRRFCLLALSPGVVACMPQAAESDIDPAASASAQAVESSLTATTNDGVVVQLYDFGGPSQGYPILLFHQAGSNARGEFAYIAQRLEDEGYRVFGADLRSGGERFGFTNQTAMSDTEVAYCDAYPDLVAASRLIGERTGQRPIVVGSSYSAALVMKLGVEHPSLVAGFASFSPAGAAGLEICAPSSLLERLEVPGMGVRPRSEMEEGPPSVPEQAAAWRSFGVPMEVTELRTHGASMLDPSRAGEGAEVFWPRFLEFLGNAANKAGA